MGDEYGKWPLPDSIRQLVLEAYMRALFGKKECPLPEAKDTPLNPDPDPDPPTE